VPVSLIDVIRAALGEVESYQRVDVRSVAPATIVGSAAADVAHLLAELVENALTFSRPDQTVDIRGLQRANGYTLAVIDSGIGTPPTDLAAGNRRLAWAESFTIAPAKYLGHYVAGSLAARRRIRIALDPSSGDGVTATIKLPPSLIAGTGDSSRSGQSLTQPKRGRLRGAPSRLFGYGWEPRDSHPPISRLRHRPGWCRGQLQAPFGRARRGPSADTAVHPECPGASHHPAACTIRSNRHAGRRPGCGD
jgi:hypothetical protein